MKKRPLHPLNFIIPVVLLTWIFSSIVYGQEGLYTIKWQDNREIIMNIKNQKKVQRYFYFENAYYGTHYLPSYANKIKVNDPDKRFEFGNFIFEEVPDSLLKDVEIPYGLTEATPELRQFTANNSNQVLDLLVPCVRINNSTGKVERLISFEINSLPISKSAVNPAFEKTVNNSMLGTGDWYKIKVRTTDIYKLTYDDILSMGFSNPADVRIFGHGGKQLSYWVSDPRPVDLPEIQFYMNKGTDGIFNSGDYILVYLEGPVTWYYDKSEKMFRQRVHGYYGERFYFVTTSHGPAVTIPLADTRNYISSRNVSTYVDYAYYEREYINVIASGRNWYSRLISEENFDTTFTFPNMRAGGNVNVLLRAAGRSKFERAGRLQVNGQNVLTRVFSSVPLDNNNGTYASELNFKYAYTSSDKKQTVGFRYEKGGLEDLAYLDYITVNSESDLGMSGNSVFFRSIDTSGMIAVSNFSLKNATASTRVWDITDINNIREIKGDFASNQYVFKDTTGPLRQYVAVNLDADFPKPVIDAGQTGVGRVANQNLRALPVHDYIIVTHEAFLTQAERLAEHRRKANGLSVFLVTPQMIYNEFSSGTPDISAIRDFFRHHYMKKTSTDSLRYVLLFGDGSVNNHMYSKGNTNYILTYQSKESLIPTMSYVSDDFYGLLGDGEGEMTGDVDIGIGRLTVRIINGKDYEAVDVVNKIIYYDTCRFGNWRKNLLLLGDDGYDPGGYAEGGQHMARADRLADFIERDYKGFVINKVYLDAYPQVSSSTGASYPEAELDLFNLLNRGQLIFIYSGHGGENQITAERVLEKRDITELTNKYYLPLFITATCQFSRYDRVETLSSNVYDIGSKTGLGEEALLNPNGGAIALFGTTRLVYGPNNEQLVKATIPYLFGKHPCGEPYRLGDVLRYAKNHPSNTTDPNSFKFSLLGDPATKLAYPEYLVITDSINGYPVDGHIDTLKAYSHVTISGYVAWNDSTIIDDFNGFVYPNVFDKKDTIVTFGNDNQPPFTYVSQDNSLYNGKATVKNGRFRFSFIVPKDINYNIGYGRIGYYADNGLYDAKGVFDSVLVGGTGVWEEDYDGPEIKLYMNDNQFTDGGITNDNPFVYAELYDTVGINTSKIGIGHEIVAVLDENNRAPYILNDYYQAKEDDFRSGTVLYQLRNLEDGEHTISLKVWDVYNNSSEAAIRFVVVTGDGPVIEKVYNYPNPARESTVFRYTHNSAGEEHEVNLEIFDISGRLITHIERKFFEGGFLSEPLQWDLESNGNADLGGGIYPYRLTVRTSRGTATVNEKLIIIR